MSERLRDTRTAGTRSSVRFGLDRDVRFRWRDLRSLRLITAEIGLIVIAAVLLTVVPQTADDPVVAARFVQEHPLLAPIVVAAGLDRILRSWWFLALLILSSLSLWLVTLGQWKRARILWRQELTAASFRGAPFRCEWTQPSAAGPSLASCEIRTSGRVSLLGLPLFHTGLLALVVAGFLGMLLRSGASVDLFEGETLPGAAPSAYGAQWPGLLDRRFALPCALTVEKLIPERYPSREIKALAAHLRVGGECEPRDVEVAINIPLERGFSTLYLTSMHGPAALFQIEADGTADRHAALLEDQGGGTYAASVSLSGSLEAKVRGSLGGDGSLPTKLEVRLVRGGGLLFVGALAPGEAVALPDGTSIALLRIPYWARFTGTNDPSTWVAYLGFVMCGTGLLLAVCLVRVDTAVIVTPLENAEKVCVALKAARFVPLYRERFERVVRELGGPEGQSA